MDNMIKLARRVGRWNSTSKRPKGKTGVKLGRGRTNDFEVVILDDGTPRYIPLTAGALKAIQGGYKPTAGTRKTTRPERKPTAEERKAIRDGYIPWDRKAIQDGYTPYPKSMTGSKSTYPDLGRWSFGLLGAGVGANAAIIADSLLNSAYGSDGETRPAPTHKPAAPAPKPATPGLWDQTNNYDVVKWMRN